MYTTSRSFIPGSHLSYIFFSNFHSRLTGESYAGYGEVVPVESEIIYFRSHLIFIFYASVQESVDFRDW